MTWRSRAFVLPRETNFGCVEVFPGQVNTPIEASQTALVTLLYQRPDGAGDSLLVSTDVRRIFRLPGGVMSGRYTVEIAGTRAVRAVHYATTISGLRAIAL